MRVAGATQDAAGHRLQHADDALHQRRFARAVGPDHRRQRPARRVPLEVVHGRMAVVAQRQVIESQTGFGHFQPKVNGIGVPALDRCDVMLLRNYVMLLRSSSRCGDENVEMRMAEASELTKNQALVFAALNKAQGPLSAYSLLDQLRGDGFPRAAAGLSGAGKAAGVRARAPAREPQRLRRLRASA